MTGKRLYQYALHVKWVIIGALALLAVSVGAEVLGPLGIGTVSGQKND